MRGWRHPSEYRERLTDADVLALVAPDEVEPPPVREHAFIVTRHRIEEPFSPTDTEGLVQAKNFVDPTLGLGTLLKVERIAGDCLEAFWYCPVT